jgi:hypothetical protein
MRPADASFPLSRRRSTLLCEQVFDEMVEGWQNQQLARGLPRQTIEPRLAMVRRFQRFTNDYPWAWRPVQGRRA